LKKGPKKSLIKKKVVTPEPNEQEIENNRQEENPEGGTEDGKNPEKKDESLTDSCIIL